MQKTTAIVMLATTYAYWSNFVGMASAAASSGAAMAMRSPIFEEFRVAGIRISLIVANGMNVSSTDARQSFNANYIGAAVDLQQPDDFARAALLCVAIRSPIVELVCSLTNTNYDRCSASQASRIELPFHHDLLL